MTIILGEYTISIEKNFNHFSLVKNDRLDMKATHMKALSHTVAQKF